MNGYMYLHQVYLHTLITMPKRIPPRYLRLALSPGHSEFSDIETSGIEEI